MQVICQGCNQPIDLATDHRCPPSSRRRPTSTPTSRTTPNPWLEVADRLRILRLQVESSQSPIGMRHLASLLLVLTDQLTHIIGHQDIQVIRKPKLNPALIAAGNLDLPLAPNSKASTPAGAKVVPSEGESRPPFSLAVIKRQQRAGRMTLARAMQAANLRHQEARKAKKASRSSPTATTGKATRSSSKPKPRKARRK